MFPEANRLHVIKQVMMWEERGERRGVSFSFFVYFPPQLETTTSNNGARHSICECAESNVQRGYSGQKIQIEDQELFEH